MEISNSARGIARSVLPRFALNGIKLARLVARQRLWGFSIGDQPCMGDASNAAFERMLEDCRFYMEYGCGGSTVLAARLGKPFISVETDRFFLKAVRKRIGTLSAGQHLLYADIGPIGPQYGAPLFKTPTDRRLEMWKSYVLLPWRHLEPGLLPDLVMIDGRFRVAAALISCAHLIDSPESRIAVDDYVGRPHYQLIEQYAQLVSTYEHMAVFKPPSGNSPQLQEAIHRFSADWR
jgi:hypothetical protein